MLINYVLADPTGNLTALVETPLDLPLRQHAAAALMGSKKEIEQLGFLAPPSKGGDIALSMAGGEFCGNACLSASAYFLRKNGLSGGSVGVEISGADGIVKVELEKLGENEYAGRVEMPLPLSCESVESPLGELKLMRFPGICHAIISTGISRSEAEKLIVPLCAKIGCEALGLMLLDEESRRLDPLVYVPGAESLFWERSCASGTTAVGAYLALREGKSLSVSLAQPGGTLSISAKHENGAVTKLLMGGKVILGGSEGFNF
ncbi:MAG: hypothetical protein J6P94_04745 [Oscillospiraceae bacterium]|nr:hypothetical protein [Oscillospiraceae bacterium]